MNDSEIKKTLYKYINVKKKYKVIKKTEQNKEEKKNKNGKWVCF